MRREYQTFDSFFFANTDNPICPSENKTDNGTCRYTSYQILEETVSYLFTNTEFSGCSHSENGGALSCSQSDASLSIEGCLFRSCSCGSKYGGAIYAKSISLLSVKNSFFNSCGGNYEAEVGGAICIESVQKMLIKENFFLKCYSRENAGAIDMRNSGSEQNEIPIQSSSFINCECLTNDGASGGALEGYGNKCGYFSSSLLSFCKAKDGGAIWLEPEFFPNSICFSFFTENIATTNHGNDISLYNYPDTLADKLFLHTFTTSESDRITKYDSQWHPVTTDQDWLPSGTVKYVNI